MAAEVVELFGIDDEVLLFRYSAADNLTNKDALWGEPTTKPAFKKFKIFANKVDPDQDEAADPEGRDITASITLSVALNHLLGAGVPADQQGDYVSEADTIGINTKGAYTEYDIIKAVKGGWVNSSEAFTGYTLTCVRREKYAPERKHP